MIKGMRRIACSPRFIITRKKKLICHLFLWRTNIFVRIRDSDKKREAENELFKKIIRGEEESRSNRPIN